MNIKNWENEYVGTIEYDNDANDYFFEWVKAHVQNVNDVKDDLNLEELFERHLKIGLDATNIGVKGGNGILFFYLKENNIENTK